MKRSYESISAPSDGVPSEGWLKIENGDCKGMTELVDKESGKVVALSARRGSDRDRWITMPSLQPFDSLKYLDLHKSRYIRQLHASVCELQDLECLILTRCERLESLPAEIGLLGNLKEVSTYALVMFQNIPFSNTREIFPA